MDESPVLSALTRSLGCGAGADPIDSFTPRPFAVGFSGGVDSTVLLHACVQLGLNVHALHVHHGLQAPADDWARHAEKACAQWNVPLTVLRVEVVRAGGQSLEAQAREARYEAMANAMRRLGIRQLLTAHHQDDHIETVLLHLFRGSGLAGLSGMMDRSPMPFASDLELLRPLLTLPKTTLITEATAAALDWVEDPSNADVDLRRNWLRQKFLPEAAALFPQLGASVERLARQVSGLRREWTDEADAFFAAHPGPSGALHLQPWRTLPMAKRIRVLKAWLNRQGIQLQEAPLLELDRQLGIEKGGLRESVRHARVRVSKGFAHLLTGE